MPKSETFTDEELDQLVVKDGFRQRGMDMTRLETFTDAAFAFAVTLLVVGGGDYVPVTFDEMLAAMQQVPAFAACFANIMFFWYAHHVWSRHYGLEDLRSSLLSMLLIFVVLIYIYPLKAIYSGAIEFFSGGYFPSFFSLDAEDPASDLRVMFTIFGVGYSSLAAVMLMLYRHALGLGDSLRLSDLERYDTQSQIYAWIVNITIPLISIVLAQTLPNNWLFAAGMFYGSFGIVMPWLAIRRGKQREQLFVRKEDG